MLKIKIKAHIVEKPIIIILVVKLYAVLLFENCPPYMLQWNVLQHGTIMIYY